MSRPVPPHLVPVVTVESLLQRHLPNRRIDFLKVDMDERWSSAAEAGLRALIGRRGVAVMLLEVDFRNDWPLVNT